MYSEWEKKKKKKHPGFPFGCVRCWLWGFGVRVENRIWCFRSDSPRTIRFFSECFFPCFFDVLFSIHPHRFCGKIEFPPSAADSNFDFRSVSAILENKRALPKKSKSNLFRVHHFFFCLSVIRESSNASSQVLMASTKSNAFPEKLLHKRESKHTTTNMSPPNSDNRFTFDSFSVLWFCWTKRKQKIDFRTTVGTSRYSVHWVLLVPNALCLVCRLLSTNIYNSFTCVRGSECEFVRTCVWSVL